MHFCFQVTDGNLELSCASGRVWRIESEITDGRRIRIEDDQTKITHHIFTLLTFYVMRWTFIIDRLSAECSGVYKLYVLDQRFQHRAWPDLPRHWLDLPSSLFADCFYAAREPSELFFRYLLSSPSARNLDALGCISEWRWLHRFHLSAACVVKSWRLRLGHPLAIPTNQEIAGQFH